MATRLQLKHEYAPAQTRLHLQGAKSPSETRGLLYHLHTIWLFPAPYVWDSILPNSLFIFSAVLSGPVLNLKSQSAGALAVKMLQVVAWMYLVLLQFSLHNQRSPISIAEDSINKPWRPIPAGRITVRQTNALLLTVYAVLVPLNWYMDLSIVFICWTLLVVGYNDLGGGETPYRSVDNALGFACELLGGLYIAVGGQLPFAVYAWVAIMSCIFLTTIHAQEFRDVAGDDAIGRRTFLTIVGASRARVLLVLGIVFWSCFVPWWLGTSWVGAAVPWVLGGIVVGLTVLGSGKADVELDRRMYQCWTLWVVSLAILPLLAGTTV